MDEAYASRYFVHTIADKMLSIKDPLGLFQQPEIPEWKWERITMDFITKLPRFSRGYDTYWVIVDRVTKSAHFLVIHEDFKIEKLERLYIDEIVARHGVPLLIISDRDGQPLGRVSVKPFKHYRYEKRRVVLTLEVVVDTHLLTEAKIGESRLYGPEIVQETNNKAVFNKERLKAARDCQKSYVSNRQKLLEFSVGDQVLLKVSSWKGVVCYGKKGKLAPRYVGPFEIIERVGLVAYRLRFPQELSSVHDTFHLSNLKKCLADANLHVQLEEIIVDKCLRFIEEHVKIMDREVKRLKRSRIPIVKVRWR
ncbi:putative reverse transcriptase domain-containing protein [Tanacetum coccineum]|uniref:Reverse transcriptase domain-containing protein n=1 Tax=Tanacetum coccineum TaxID=301880 RepID=A0ABQ5GE66_9ASTR